jgi:hypothetical protein
LLGRRAAGRAGSVLRAVRFQGIGVVRRSPDWSWLRFCLWAYIGLFAGINCSSVLV